MGSREPPRGRCGEDLGLSFKGDGSHWRAVSRGESLGAVEAESVGGFKSQFC